ncbi:sensor histidine kinase [Curtobacterium sp. MCBD17_021]|uniref:sensor histidine kinase n=1 Tax=Curtobacterium sp. MCBD17_021 TaxID=2175665 RepID=UPI000DAA8870|nr:histidine kinase [Curtobacterium sp. MCBD17_021]PZE69019.1 sensor histidine kinase [Curtobacterium sp. MCBD17_021]
MFRPLLRTQIVVDVSVAIVLGGLITVLSGADVGGVAGLGTIAGLTLALALRRMAPGLGLAVAWVTAAFQMATLQDPNIADAMVAGVVYTTSVYGSRRVRVLGLVSAVVGAVLAGVYTGVRIYGVSGIGGRPESLMESVNYGITWFVFTLAVLLLPWLAGLAVRARRSARMSREAQLLAERDAARADRAVAIEQERVRIARDMHDIVAHSLAVVIAQADGARYALRADPAVADEALGTIGSTARRALGDVRELLGALRHEQGTAPTPDVDDIEQLVGQMRDVGLDVQVERQGDPSALPTTTQLAVYRIVQESLTNAYKHGERGAPVRARLTYRPDTVEIDVVNRRAEGDRPGPGTGHGLVGMRERATMSGGSMTAGPRGEDFAVAVRMPAQPSTGQMPRNTIPSTNQERSPR